MWTLVLRDLQHRATRFVVVVVATAVVFTLLLLMTGLVAQFEREPHEGVARLGADVWLLREGASGAFTNASVLDDALAALVVDGRASPVVMARHLMEVGSGPRDVVLVGVEPGGVGAPELADGPPELAADEVVIATSAGVVPGESLVIGDRALRVRDTVADATLLAGMSMVFLPIETARALAYRGQPLSTGVLVEGTVIEVPDGLALVTNAEIAEDARRPLERAIASLHLIRVLLWLVAAMIVGAVVYLSALERQRDFAVLKAVGASPRGLLGGVAIQGALIALTAALVAGALTKLIGPTFPLDVWITAGSLAGLPVAAVVVALGASAAGLSRVRRADPAAAFAGPGG